MHAIAEARSNIALIKYWGKIDTELNLPAVPSLSLTVDGMTTRTTVHFDPSLSTDSLHINDRPADELALERVSRQLDRVAALLREGHRPRAVVRSHNDFPTAAGLASSASAFAALTVAAVAALGGNLERAPMSELARRASGSAARSLFGGLVLLSRGTRGEPHSSVASPVGAEAEWQQLRLVVGIVSESPKDLSSSTGMTQSQSGPYYRAWLTSASDELRAALQAIIDKNLEALGAATERSALRMHACAMAAPPGVVYLRGPTIEGLHAIRQLRRSGVPAWFTCDAGPHPKALTTAEHAEEVASTLRAVPGVLRVLVLGPGAGARLLPSSVVGETDTRS